MPTYRGRKATFGIDNSGGGTYAYLPFVNVPKSNPHMLDLYPGKGNVNALQAEYDERGGRRFYMPGLVGNLRGQPSSGTGPPEEDFLFAAGFARTGSTGLTYTLGDYHLSSGDAAAGNAVRIPGVRHVIDTRARDGASVLANIMFDWQAAKHPLLTYDLYGLIPALKTDGVTALGVNDSGVGIVTAPSALSGSTLKSLPWLNSTVTIGGVACVLRRVLYNVGNVIEWDRASAGAKHGYEAPLIVDRKPSIQLMIETPTHTTFNPEDAALAGTSIAVSFTYQASGAGGAFCVFTVTFTCRFRAGLEEGERGGFIHSTINAQQDELTGPLTLAISAL